MIDVRPFNSLGAADHGWLSAHHHFSFGHYYDPNRVGWGRLLVWNDDQIKPGTGFPRHGHRDMEIITYVRKGAITHRDHLGNEGRTEAGDVQVMSAGTGIQHEEWNLEADTDTELFQIWIEPSETGRKPSWASARFPKDDRRNSLVALASGRTGMDAGALPIGQDAAILGATLEDGREVTHQLQNGRLAYLVVSKGEVMVNGIPVPLRAAAAIRDEKTLTIRANGDAEFVLADLPPE